MDDDNEDEYLPPANTVTLRVPYDPELRTQYELYKPSKATRRLYSERFRSVFPEAFIDNERLGTLADLSARALAQMSTRFTAPPGMETQFYEGLDVNLPLQDCYFITDAAYWRRVVLAKTTDQSLQLKKVDEYDWRGKGISLKYVELVEACPAAYWPEQQMAQLGYRVRDYMRTMHIRHLQSLPDHYYKHFVESEEELDVSSQASEDSVISSDEAPTPEEEEECEEEEEPPEPVQVPVPTNQLKINVIHIKPELESAAFSGAEGSMTSGYSKSNASEARRESRNARNAARQLLRDLREEKKAEHERRKRARSLLNKVPEVVKSKKKKKKTPKTIKDVFNMEVPPEPEDHELNIYDRRNQEKLVRRHKRYDYPAKDCHHIDLSFVRYFDKLVSLTLEFMGPKMERGYHKRHLNFSYDDMRRLAKGLRTLQQLRVFRLRNSRMDNLKLLILTRAINQLDNLEVLDFGYDQLTDNCDVALKMLLDRSCMYKALELEYNRLDRSCLEAISNSLRKHRGNALEYLGLAHNPLSNAGLTALVHNLVGTNHVQELNIAGIETSPEHTANELSFLLRNHKPLRSLNMVAIALNPKVGRELICGLVTNNKLTHFDCRGCDLDVQQELEADLIVRCNNYRLTHPYVENDEHTEEMVLQFLADSRHPIIQNLLNKDAQMEECLRNRPAFLPSEESVEEEERLVEEEEMDIWAILGIKNPNAAALAPDRIKSVISTLTGLPQQSSSFVFDPNSFTLEEFREHAAHFGLENRHYYFQQQKKLYR